MTLQSPSYKAHVAKPTLQSPCYKVPVTKFLVQSTINGINQAGSCYKYPRKPVTRLF